ncbi:MAG: fructose-bisphosphate aldolase class I [Chloroflexota bacterium]|nr:fructose-bisphosphate aldolase class I [Chloroflexota bacterium]
MSRLSTEEIANQLVTPGKGIMAADRPSPAFREMMEAEGISHDRHSYRNWSELLFKAPNLNESVSGIIMTDEQVRMADAGGEALLPQVIERDMIPGISPFTGMVTLAGSAGETVGSGLDGLRERLAEYADMGVGFSKWRAALQVGPGTPSYYAIEANAYVMAQVAALSQEAGIVPIVEPEVMLWGDHNIERCFEVTEFVLWRTFEALYVHRVDPEGTLVKASMVLSGSDCAEQADVDQVAELTVKAFKRRIPAAIPGIVFLSGGQSDWHATAHLNAMNANYELPWKLSFSYARALQREPMAVWANQAENVPAAQAALLHRAKMNGLAALGLWTDELERAAVA